MHGTWKFTAACLWWSRDNSKAVFWLKLTAAKNAELMPFIGGGAYWAGRAAARPLFSTCGQSLFFARPLFVVENLYLVVIQQCRVL